MQIALKPKNNMLESACNARNTLSNYISRLSDQQSPKLWAHALLLRLWEKRALSHHPHSLRMGNWQRLAKMDMCKLWTMCDTTSRDLLQKDRAKTWRLHDKTAHNSTIYNSDGNRVCTLRMVMREKKQVFTHNDLL
jgi:hypothetical protein